jgi:hypothetical protein
MTMIDHTRVEAFLVVIVSWGERDRWLTRRPSRRRTTVPLTARGLHTFVRD